MTQLLHLPPWLFGSVIVTIFIIAGVTGLAVFNRFIRNRLHLTESMNNDIIFFASAISVFYSLIVGLIAVGVWRTYTEAQSIVSEEATAIGCFYRDIGGLAQAPPRPVEHENRKFTNFFFFFGWAKENP